MAWSCSTVVKCSALGTRSHMINCGSNLGSGGLKDSARDMYMCTLNPDGKKKWREKEWCDYTPLGGAFSLFLFFPGEQTYPLVIYSMTKTEIDR